MKITTYPFRGPIRLTLAVVADLHDLPCDDALQALHTIKPDYIIVPGDLIERLYGFRTSSDAQNAKGPLPRKLSIALTPHEHMSPVNGYRFIQEASRIAPIIYSLGNHEGFITEDDKRIIGENDVILLDNCDMELAGLFIGGLSTNPDFYWLEKYRNKPGYKVLLCHHPEYYDKLGLNDFDLVISGHAHGGQIRLLGHGLYAPGQGFFPKLTKGQYRNMIISAGCSNTLRIPRFGNPEEIVVIELS